MSKLITTLCIVHKDSKILLGMKKRDFGKGRWNGFGGKVKEGETIEESLRRETKEEAGIELGQLEKIAVMDFEFGGDPNLDSRRALDDSKKETEVIEVHLFKAGDFSGELRESDEMRPQWFSVSEIPFDEMWPDDIFWMPLFLEGKKFKGRFFFGKKDVILEKELKEVEEL